MTRWLAFLQCCRTAWIIRPCKSNHRRSPNFTFHQCRECKTFSFQIRLHSCFLPLTHTHTPSLSLSSPSHTLWRYLHPLSISRSFSQSFQRLHSLLFLYLAFFLYLSLSLPLCRTISLPFLSTLAKERGDSSTGASRVPSLSSSVALSLSLPQSHTHNGEGRLFNRAIAYTLVLSLSLIHPLTRTRVGKFFKREANCK